ncbi:UNVERIFIED_CONTAM: hypothetical protein Sradi_6981400 [Sesamum radiatum]|uniref:Uncharacterized protein n=1 Tax=Sesamum radiatum TaxID=300843 RepID=A0AAW2JDY6_SESRA
MKNYIQELGVVPTIAEPVVIFCDNNGAIAQEKELRSHHRSKHILRRFHLLREMMGRGDGSDGPSHISRKYGRSIDQAEVVDCSCSASWEDGFEEHE